MSASEMTVFCRYLGLIIGDRIPINNEYWEIYMTLSNILDIVNSRTITSTTHILLATLISEHHLLYTSLFKDSLKPKHHHMVHYPRIMKNVGPLVNLSSMRFEAKHRESKLVATATTSRKNISHTITFKHQLRFCHQILSTNILSSRNECGPIHPVNLAVNTDKHNNVLFPACEKLFSVSWIMVDGILYKPFMSLVLNNNNDMLQFGIINNIFLIDDELSFSCILTENLGFDEHFHAFQIIKRESKTVFVKKCSLFSLFPCTLVDGSESQYVIVRNPV